MLIFQIHIPMPKQQNKHNIPCWEPGSAGTTPMMLPSRPSTSEKVLLTYIHGMAHFARRMGEGLR